MVFIFLLLPLDFLRQAVNTEVSPLALKAFAGDSVMLVHTNMRGTPQQEVSSFRPV